MYYSTQNCVNSLFYIYVKQRIHTIFVLYIYTYEVVLFIEAVWFVEKKISCKSLERT